MCWLQSQVKVTEKIRTAPAALHTWPEWIIKAQVCISEE
jgi:hypothetical protein